MNDLIERLLYEEESTTLDFKKEQYSFIKKNDYEKSELLKDILAFANAWRRGDSYILIGVQEVKGGKSLIVGIDKEDKIDDASLQEFVNKKTNKPISFEYKNVTIDNKMIGVIKIPLENNQRPFFLKNKYGKLKKNEVKIRRNSSTDSADPDEVSKMHQDYISIKKDPVLEIEFANNKSKISLGKALNLKSEFWNIIDQNDIPDYTPTDKYRLDPYILAKPNYYRELIKHYTYKELYQPISYSLYNDSDILSTDIKVEIRINTKEKEIDFMKEKEIPRYPKKTQNLLGIHMKNFDKIESSPDIFLEKRESMWYVELYFKKVQPKQKIFTEDTIYIFIKGEAIMDYTIYADNISEPIKDQLRINHIITKMDKSYREIISMDKEIKR